jgi:hypothetical protein
MLTWCRQTLHHKSSSRCALAVVPSRRPDSESKPSPHISGMADLTDADKATIAAVLRETIASDRFLMSPRIRRLKVT